MEELKDEGNKQQFSGNRPERRRKALEWLECNAGAVERKGLRQKLVTSTTDQLAAAAAANGDDDGDGAFHFPDIDTRKIG